MPNSKPAKPSTKTAKAASAKDEVQAEVSEETAPKGNGKAAKQPHPQSFLVEDKRAFSPCATRCSIP
jgi:hypothetical protein